MTEVPVLSQRANEALVLTRAIVDPAADTRKLSTLVNKAATAASAATGALTMLIDHQVTVTLDAGQAAGPPVVQEDLFEDTFCVNVLRTDAVLVIPNATADQRVSSLPMVLRGAVGAYLGAPIRRPSGIVGVLCVVDSHPRVWTDEQLDEVSGIADEIVLELQRIADQVA